MKRQELFDRFDAVMASLKPVSPSVAFDLEFKRRFSEAVADRYKETLYNRLTAKAIAVIEALKYSLAGPRPVLVRALATFVFLVASGLYIYSTQPSIPAISPAEGLVLVQGKDKAGWEKLSMARALKTGDVIMTGDGAQADIKLTNMYAIRIKQNAKLKIAALTPRYGKGSARFELIEGKALINVGEGFKGSKFIMDTRAGTATALGTKFAVDVSKDELRSKVSVLEGKVKVNGSYRPKSLMLARSSVTVDAGQKTEVSVGGLPLTPQRLMEKEWSELEELYQLGKKPQVILLIKNTPDRVRQLLTPCPIYISDESPREIPQILDKAILKIADAVKTKDNAKHLEAIKLLERIVEESPNPKYDAQLLLYIGAYYEYLSYHEEAIKTFDKILIRYPDSTLASLAQVAVGVIYEEKLHDTVKADRAFRAVLKRYPYSLEALWVESRIGIKKVS